MVRLEGHPTAGDVLRGEAHRRERVGEWKRWGDQSLERRRRWGALVGRRGNRFRTRGVGRRRGFIAAAVVLAAVAAEPPGHESRILILRETHLRKEAHHQSFFW